MCSGRQRTLLLVGNWRWEVYEPALAAGFRACGWKVVPFDTRDYTRPGPGGRLEAAMRVGPGVAHLNKMLLETARVLGPDAVLLNRCDTVQARTLHALKCILPHCALLLYHNDNPFARKLDGLKFRHYLAGIHVADATLVYRPTDVDAAQRRGARRVELVMPYYVSYLHRRVAERDVSEPKYDVVYAGHYEDDGREGVLDAIARCGARILVCGAGWGHLQRTYSWAHDMDSRPRFGPDYTETLASARMALGFLSAKNRDVYTRRCFEIPACGTLLLAPRTPELEALFEADREAVFFSSTDELVRSVQRYLADPVGCDRIAHAGHDRCVLGENDEVARARQITHLVERILSERGSQ